MKTVGVRELKNRLSEYLRHVRSGEGVLVTDRGEVVAELTLPGQAATDPSVSPGLLALARKRLVTLGGQNDVSAYPALKRGLRTRRCAELLNEQRGGR